MGPCKDPTSNRAPRKIRYARESRDAELPRWESGRVFDEERLIMAGSVTGALKRGTGDTDW